MRRITMTAALVGLLVLNVGCNPFEDGPAEPKAQAAPKQVTGTQTFGTQSPGQTNLNGTPPGGNGIDVFGDGIDFIPGGKKGAFGRPQFILLDEKAEKDLGAKFYKEILQKEKNNVLGDNEKLVKQVVEVTNRLIKATKLSKRNFDYEVKVLRKKEANAFCLPGGKMTFFSGMTPICKTDAGLAAVMGHEIAHALCSHGAENISQQIAVDMGINFVTFGKMSEKQREQVRDAVNLVTLPALLKYSRMMESEADHAGVLLMATAGYNPREAVQIWERMKVLTKGKEPPEFLSTHPSHETRIRDLTNWIPEAMPLYRASGHRDEPKKLHLQLASTPTPSPPPRFGEGE